MQLKELAQLDVSSLRHLRKSQAKAKAREPFVSTAPAINLLPDYVMEQLRLKQVQHKFRNYIILAVVVVLGCVLLAQGRVSQQSTKLTQAQAQAAQAKKTLTKLEPVRVYFDQIHQAEKTMAKQMSSEVLYSQVLGFLKAATPSNVSVSTVSLAINNAPAASGASQSTSSAQAAHCPGSDPFHPAAAVGCVSFTGTAPDRGSLGTLLVNLGRNPTFTSPYIASSNVSGANGISFTASVGITSRVFLHRYANEYFILRGVSK